jgi:hypothetical protein
LVVGDPSRFGAVISCRQGGDLKMKNTMRVALVILAGCIGAASAQPFQQPPDRASIWAIQIPVNTVTVASATDHHFPARSSTALPVSPDSGGTEYLSVKGFKFKITDGLLALFTLFLVFVGTWQGWHLRKTVESFEVGERPYIYPSAPELGPITRLYITPPAPPFVALKFGNFGKTIAIIRTIRGELVLGTLPRTRNYSYSPLRAGYVVARPDQETEQYSFNFSRLLTPDDTKNIVTAALEFHFFGEVTYTDIFSRIHEKAFAFRLEYHPGRDIAECHPAGGRGYNYIKSRKAPKEYQG